MELGLRASLRETIRVSWEMVLLKHWAGQDSDTDSLAKASQRSKFKVSFSATQIKEQKYESHAR